MGCYLQPILTEKKNVFMQHFCNLNLSILSQVYSMSHSNVSNVHSDALCVTCARFCINVF